MCVCSAVVSPPLMVNFTGDRGPDMSTLYNGEREGEGRGRERGGERRRVGERERREREGERERGREGERERDHTTCVHSLLATNTNTLHTIMPASHRPALSAQCVL